MKRRRWVESGIVEELDKRQVALLERVTQVIYDYYQNSGTNTKPLNLTHLAKLADCSHSRALSAIRLLANSVNEDEPTPLIYYTKIPTNVGYKKRYNIFLNQAR